MNCEQTSRQLYKLQWDYGNDIYGFLLEEIQSGWIIINFFDSDFCLNGFKIINRGSIRHLDKVDDFQIYARYILNTGITPNHPNIKIANIFEDIDKISSKWKVIGISDKISGYDSIEMVIVESTSGNCIYYKVSDTPSAI
jgi:hypothetical protein